MSADELEAARLDWAEAVATGEPSDADVGRLLATIAARDEEAAMDQARITELTRQRDLFAAEVDEMPRRIGGPAVAGPRVLDLLRGLERAVAGERAGVRACNDETLRMSALVASQAGELGLLRATIALRDEEIARLRDVLEKIALGHHPDLSSLAEDALRT